MENQQDDKKGLIGIKNWIGKIFLMILGAIWLISDVYDNIMANFFLTDRDVTPWGTIGDWGVLFATTSLVLGGLYLNTLYDIIKNKI